MKVFDSSAVLAVLFDEPGAALAIRWLEDDDALISSVNQAEVFAKLLDRGLSEADITAIAQQLPLQVVPFSAQQARTAASLRPATRALGLSLGDRCCLALASEQPGAQVVTADRPWVGLAGFDIALIR
ncbi:MAG: type II toxin-antitoxin system VapC family toxin [Aquabacterium sp.]|nr:type II toxin-antitoxin system VapC family toxin [Aquabacterium sp.]